MPRLRTAKPSFEFLITKVLGLEERLLDFEKRYKELELRDTELQADIDALEQRLAALTASAKVSAQVVPLVPDWLKRSPGEPPRAA